MYHGLTSEICETAWIITRQAFTRAATAKIVNKMAGAIVVLHPVTGDVLFSEHIDPFHSGAAKYEEFALAKALVTYDTRLPSRVVQQQAPHLLRPGMVKWGGSAIRDDLIVAFSGVEPVFDEAIAETMLSWIIALCRHEMTKEGGMMDDESAYIGGASVRDFAMEVDAAGFDVEQRLVREMRDGANGQVPPDYDEVEPPQTFDDALRAEGARRVGYPPYPNA